MSSARCPCFVSAVGLDQSQQNINRNLAGDAFQYGGLERNLANAKADSANQETLRRRGEVLGQLNGATAVSGSNVQWGVPEIKTLQPNPYMDFLKFAAQAGGRAMAGGA